MRSPRITEHPTDMTVARNDPVTLKCSADGTPAPTIEWYRDGELIISSNGNGHKSGSNSHRVMLPGGDLFFFRVVHGRKESDAGVYWCLARNPQGSSRSRNATLTVACKSCYSIYLLFVFFRAAAFAATATAAAIIVFHETILHSAVRNAWDDHACCVAHLPYNSYYCYYHSHNERSCHLPNPR